MTLPSDTPDLPPPAELPAAVPARRSAWLAVARGLALFIGLFSLANLILDAGNYDANIWWISFRPFPALVKRIALGVAAVVFLAFAIAPPLSGWRRRATMTTVELLWLMVGWNVVEFYVRLGRGTIRTPWPVPFSFFVALGLLLVWRAAGARWRARSGVTQWIGIVITFAACIVVVPVLEMVCFGLTDYRQAAGPADVIVVFGARVFPDGTPSEALTDRVQVGAALYREQRLAYPLHLPPKLILSGGKGDDEPMNEVEAMQRLAIKAGVPVEDILRDPRGVDTAATVANTAALFEEMVRQWADEHHKEPIVLAVSHFYHLPRVKMAYAQDGWRYIYTVPVRRALNSTPGFMAREVAALWWYYAEAFGR